MADITSSVRVSGQPLGLVADTYVRAGTAQDVGKFLKDMVPTGRVKRPSALTVDTGVVTVPSGTIYVIAVGDALYKLELTEDVLSPTMTDGQKLYIQAGFLPAGTLSTLLLAGASTPTGALELGTYTLSGDVFTESDQPAFTGTGRMIDLSTVVPGTETSGSLVTTKAAWVVVTSVGGCAVKLLCSYSGASGDYATLRMRARADAAMGSNNGVVCGNFSASANINNHPNLYGVQGYAQPNAFSQNNAAQINCGVYSCIDAGGVSSGKDWSTWSDTHATRKPTGLSCLHRLSHNGTASYDAAFSVYCGGRMPALFNFEDEAGFLVDSGDAGSTKAGYLFVVTPAGIKKIQLVVT